jgi:hypothetical protein
LAARELSRITVEYERLLIKEAASRGPVTPKSLRAAARRLRRTRQDGRRLSPATWDAAVLLGTLGVSVDAYFGSAHPLAVIPLTGLAVSTLIAAAGIVGKWQSRNRE